MDALKAEAKKIEAEIEEFSRRTAKEVASLVTAISDIEDESDKMMKRERLVDAEIETLVKDKKAIKEVLNKNDKRLKELSVKKNQMDQKIDIEMKRLKDRDSEVKEILSRLSKSDTPKQANTSVDSEMVDFLKEAIKRKEEDLLCPVCLETAQIPIFTCPDSHIICSACVPKLKVQECPQCRGELPNPLRRHRFAEKTAAELEDLLEKMKKVTGIDSHLDREAQVGSTIESGTGSPAGKEARETAKETYADHLRFRSVTQPPMAKRENVGTRKPSDTQQLFVGNLPHNCTEDRLRELFDKYGKVVDVQIHHKQNAPVLHEFGRPAGAMPFGFIVFESADSVSRALAENNFGLYGVDGVLMLNLSNSSSFIKRVVKDLKRQND